MPFAASWASTAPAVCWTWAAGPARDHATAGYTGSTRIEVGGGQVVDRGIDEIVSAVFSLSGSAPHLFADQLPTFEADLRRLLKSASPSGRFSERTREIAVLIWRP